MSVVFSWCFISMSFAPFQIYKRLDFRGGAVSDQPLEEPGAESGVKELPMVFHESMNRSKDWQGGVWSARQNVVIAATTLRCKWLRRTWSCTCPRPGLSRDKQS